MHIGREGGTDLGGEHAYMYIKWNFPRCVDTMMYTVYRNQISVPVFPLQLGNLYCQ